MIKNQILVPKLCRQVLQLEGRILNKIYIFWLKCFRRNSDLMEYKSPIQPLSDFYPMDVTQMPVKVNFKVKLSKNNNNKTDTKSFFLILPIEGLGFALIKKCNLLCVLSLWRTNRKVPLENLWRQWWKSLSMSSSSLQGQAKLVLSGWIRITIRKLHRFVRDFPSPSMRILYFFFFVGIIVPFCRKITAEHRHWWLTLNYIIVNSSEEVLEMSDKQANSFSSDGG